MCLPCLSFLALFIFFLCLSLSTPRRLPLLFPLFRMSCYETSFLFFFILFSHFLSSAHLLLHLPVSSLSYLSSLSCHCFSSRSFSFSIFFSSSFSLLLTSGEHYVGRVLLQRYTSVPYVPLLTCPVSVKTSESLPQVVSPPAPKTLAFKQAQNDIRRALVDALHPSSSPPPRTAFSSGSPGSSSSKNNSPSEDSNDQRKKKKKSDSTPNSPSSSSSSSSLWPDLETLHEKDLLFDVIKKGVLTVSGLGPRTAPEGENARSFREYYLNHTLMKTKKTRKTAGDTGDSSTDGRKSSSSREGRGGQQEDEEEQEADEEDLQRQREKEELFFSQSSRGFNWGEEGDYSKQPPQGKINKREEENA